MESIAKVIDWTSTEEINTSVNYTVIIFDLIRKWLSYHLFNRHIGKRHFVARSSCPESSPSCHFQWQALTGNITYWHFLVLGPLFKECATLVMISVLLRGLSTQVHASVSHWALGMRPIGKDYVAR